MKLNSRSYLALRLVLLLLVAVALYPAGARSQSVAPSPGLTVSAEGILLKDGKPYRAVGANYFSAFTRCLANPADTSYREGFKALTARHIPFARFMAGGFWPNEWKLYFDNKPEYFRLMDGVVKAAEEEHVGLIASLFWYYANVPDLVGEPMDQWGNPQSKTHAFMRQYIQEVVGRYKDSPAIWGWEFGNEFTEAGDLPNASALRPPIIPSRGTAAGPRTEHDELTQKMIAVAFIEFAKAVRAIDPHRIIETGNALPRGQAYHNVLNLTWEQDTPNQFAEMLLRQTPDPMNVISVHVYNDCDGRYFNEPKVSTSALLRQIRTVAAVVHKPVFVGEFGAPAELGRAAERAAIVKLLAELEENQIPLSAVWDFDQRGEPQPPWNITTTNERAYILDLVGAANDRIQAAANTPPKIGVAPQPAAAQQPAAGKP